MADKKLKTQNSKLPTMLTLRGASKTTAQSAKVKKEKVVKKKVEATVKAVGSKKGSVSIDVLDTKGKVLESLALPKEIFGAAENKQLLAQAVRVYLANQRAGSASTKTRGEVRGSTRKIYKQKGTGRARHGGIRAPLFVGGGIAHGPRPFDHSRTMPTKMKQKALFSALSGSIKAKEIMVVSGFAKLAPKTKEMVSVLEKLTLSDRKKGVLKKVLFVQAKEAENVKRAARNIAGVTLVNATQLNAYDVLNYRRILFAKEALEELIGHYIKK